MHTHIYHAYYMYVCMYVCIYIYIYIYIYPLFLLNSASCVRCSAISPDICNNPCMWKYYVYMLGCLDACIYIYIHTHVAFLTAASCLSASSFFRNSLSNSSFCSKMCLRTSHMMAVYLSSFVCSEIRIGSCVCMYTHMQRRLYYVYACTRARNHTPTLKRCRHIWPRIVNKVDATSCSAGSFYGRKFIEQHTQQRTTYMMRIHAPAGAVSRPTAAWE